MRSFSACRSSVASAMSAAKSTWASAAARTLEQAARSNIHAGTSRQRAASAPLVLQRKTMPSDLSIASWTKTRKPNQGCHRYRSSRTSVPWVFSSLVVQQRAAPLAARLDEPRHLCRSTAVRCAALRRRLRSADRRHPRPTGHNRTPDSNRNWIRIGGNVTGIELGFEPTGVGSLAVSRDVPGSVANCANSFDE
jgi:hypothetical protein